MTAALAGTAAYIVAVTVGALGVSRAGGLCDDHPDCAVEFGAWLAANALIGIGMCALALSLCACASCSSKRGLTPRCRSAFAFSAVVGLVVVAASTIAGGVVMWHPQKCFASCDLASKVRPAAGGAASVRKRLPGTLRARLEAWRSGRAAQSALLLTRAIAGNNGSGGSAEHTTRVVVNAGGHCVRTLTLTIALADRRRQPGRVSDSGPGGGGPHGVLRCAAARGRGLLLLLRPARVAQGPQRKIFVELFGLFAAGVCVIRDARPRCGAVARSGDD